RTSNEGANWNAVNTGLTDGLRIGLAVSGANLFVGGVGGVHRSNNNGDSWTPVNNGLPIVVGSPATTFDVAVNGTSIFTTTGADFFTGAGGGVYRTNDNGANWTLTG